MNKTTKPEAQERPILAMGLFGRSSAAPAKLRGHIGSPSDPRGVVQAA